MKAWIRENLNKIHTVNAFSQKQNLYIIVTDITLRNEQETNYEAYVAC